MSEISVLRKYIETVGEYRFVRTIVREEIDEGYMMGWWFIYIVINIDKQIEDKRFAESLWVDPDNYHLELPLIDDLPCSLYKRYDLDSTHDSRRIKLGFDFNTREPEVFCEDDVLSNLKSIVDYFHEQSNIIEWK